MPVVKVSDESCREVKLPMYNKKRHSCVGMVYMKFSGGNQDNHPSSWSKYLLNINLNVEHDQNLTLGWKMATAVDGEEDNTVTYQNLSQLSILHFSDGQLTLKLSSSNDTVTLWSPCEDVIAKWNKTLVELIAVAGERERCLKQYKSGGGTDSTRFVQEDCSAEALKNDEEQDEPLGNHKVDRAPDNNACGDMRRMVGQSKEAVRQESSGGGGC